MSTHRYTVPVEQTEWHLPGHATDVVFNWEYDTGRDRLLSLYEQGKDKQWKRMDLPADDCVAWMDQSLIMGEYRKRLFSRLVPNLKKIGMWGRRVQDTFVEMGVIDYQSLEPEDLFADDQRIADELLAARAAQVDAIISAGRDGGRLT